VTTRRPAEPQPPAPARSPGPAGEVTDAEAAEAGRRLAALYTRVAPDYAALGPPFFAHAGRRLVALAGVAPGHRVLDVATGRGAVLFPAAERVGPAGRAVGIDLAPGMVAHTRAAAAARGLGHAEVRRLDAAALGRAFPAGAFDRALCGFAVFFFPDLPRVLAGPRRVPAPGGVAGFAFSRGHDPRWAWYEARLRELGALEGLPPPPGSGAVLREGALVAALAAAGFAGAREPAEPAELHYADGRAWWASLWTHGSRVALEHLARRDPAALARLEAEALARAEALEEPRGVPERVPFVYVTATSPGPPPGTGAPRGARPGAGIGARRAP
jgi:O-methyltransferase / aklanonic acid methyltransferase